jgi:hypothetical protein
MIPLESDRWAELPGARGDGSLVPRILQDLRRFRRPRGMGERARLWDPWPAAYSEIVDRDTGAIFAVSYAAAPHLVWLCRDSDSQALPHLLELVARIEVGRCRDDAPEMPRDLLPGYLVAMTDLHAVLAGCPKQRWVAQDACRIAGAFLAVNGAPRLAASVLDAPRDRPRDLDDGRPLIP